MGGRSWPCLGEGALSISWILLCMGQEKGLEHDQG